MRGGAHANDGCEGAGQMIAFPKTKADRLASGDPRLSLEELPRKSTRRSKTWSRSG